jgi:membrane-associated phospholipid phosphatase
MLKVLGATERASVFHTELMSRLNFTLDEVTSGATKARRLSVRHLELATPKFEELVKITRPSEAKFIKQLDLVNQYADLRSDRSAEILAQLNAPTAFFSSIVALDISRFPRTLELLNATLRLAYSVVIQIKHGLACRRPQEYSPQIQPMIPVPQHGAFPSGHATEAFIAAYVFWALLHAINARASSTTPPPPSGATQYAHMSWGTQFMRLASRIAINRTVAGVHFPADSAAGAFLGLTLGQYFVARSAFAVDMSGTAQDSQYESWTFDGLQFGEHTDFVWQNLFDVGKTPPEQKCSEPYIGKAKTAHTIAGPGQSMALKWLWDEAVDEWL